DLDSFALERIPHRQQYLAAHITGSFNRVLDPKAEREIKRFSTELDEMTNWRRLGQDARHCRGGRDRNTANLMRIARHIDAELELETDVVLAVRPVDDALCDQVFIGNENLAAVARDHRNIAGIHRRHPAEAVADGHYVAWLDRLVGQKNDAADEIRDDLLQSEADTDADGPGEDRDRGYIDPGRTQHGQDGQRDQGQPHKLADQHLNGRRQVRQQVNAGVEEVACRGRYPQRRQHQNDHFQEEKQRQTQASDGDRQRVESTDGRVENAQNAE